MTLDTPDLAYGGAEFHEDSRSKRAAVRMLALTRYDTLGASSRYRIMQYRPNLAEAGIEVDVRPMLDNAYVSRLYSGQAQDFVAILNSYIRRILDLRRSGRYDVLWIEKEAVPFLPGPWEGRVLRGRGPYIVDYDDAVFHLLDQHPNPAVRRLLGGKHDAVMAHATVVTAGNTYIAERATAAGARRVEVLPTVVDLSRYATADPAGVGLVRVGWIGTPGTAKFLKLLQPVLERLHGDDRMQFVSIGSGDLDWAEGRIDVRPWSEDTEVEELRRLAIGVMPLPDLPFERGKSGLKLIQYMAVGLPVVASPVGANRDIVDHGVNGFLCSTDEEWASAIRRLINDPELRRRLGAAGRAKVEARYSLSATAPRLATLVRDVTIGAG